MNVNMNMNMQTSPNARRWHLVMLGILAALMMHLTVDTDAMRTDEPWPMLLPDNSAGGNPAITPLQQRANGSLEKLVQSARELEQL